MILLNIVLGISLVISLVFNILRAFKIDRLELHLEWAQESKNIAEKLTLDRIDKIYFALGNVFPTQFERWKNK